MKLTFNRQITFPLMLILWSFLAGYMFKTIDWFRLFPQSKIESHNQNTHAANRSNLTQSYIPKGLHSDLSGRFEIPCPAEEDAIILVGFGQSNSANAQGQRYESNTNKIINFYNGRCYPAVDPMLGSTGNRGSIWIPVAKKLQTDKSIVIMAFGVGGTSISEWLDQNKLSLFYQANKNSLKTIYNNPDYIIWIQGESDKNTSPPVYKEQLSIWLNSVMQDFQTATILITGTTYCHGVGNDKIVTIQEEVAKDLNAIYIGSTDKFNELSDRYDNCHFSAQGVNKVSDMIAESITTQIESASRTTK